MRPSVVRTSSPTSPRRDGLVAAGIDDLGDVRRLDDHQRAGPPRALVRHGADLRHAVMVEDGRPGPCHFDLFARGRHAAARLAGDDDRSARRARPSRHVPRPRPGPGVRRRSACSRGRSPRCRGWLAGGRGCSVRRRAGSGSPSGRPLRTPSRSRGTARRRRRSRRGRPARLPAAAQTCFQLSSIHCQLSGVSSQRSGTPLVALVCVKRL